MYSVMSNPNVPDLIDTLWNVKKHEVGFFSLRVTRFNRYIVECKVLATSIIPEFFSLI